MPPTYALIGWPLAFSLSPAMHRAAFRAAGIDADYVLRPTPPGQLPAAVDDLRAGQLAGANVTVPYKVDIRRWLDDESDLAAAVGAVNTVVRTPDGGLRGENTDVAGFRHALAALDVAASPGARAVLIGAGGAARAVGLALLDAGFHVRILSRSTARGGTVAGQLYRARPGAGLASALLTPAALVEAAARAALVVNATTLGAGGSAIGGAIGSTVGGTGADHPPERVDLTAARGQGGPGAGAADRDSPWPEDVPVPAHLVVIDIVAWPLETPFVRHARACGARAAGGLDMLVGQAAAAFRLWTGIAPPLDVMHAAALAEAAGACAVDGDVAPESERHNDGHG